VIPNFDSAPELPQLALGGVQFGLPYGVANRLGQPHPTEVREILRAAFDGGIRTIDTAAAYGNSEAVIGYALRELGLKDEFLVVTKIQPLTEEERQDEGLARETIRGSLTRSLDALGVDSLPVVLFHRDADSVMLPVLREFRHEGLVQRVGVSCANATPEVPEWILQTPMDAVQIPGSLVDQRYLRSGVAANVRRKGGLVFVRSVYLQGLMLLAPDCLPVHLDQFAPVIHYLTSIADAYDTTVAELALRFLLRQSDISYVVIGMESVEQVKSNLRIVEQGPLGDELCELIQSGMPEFRREYLVPAIWESLRGQSK
jgi:aryl-alcohol dehydrogenase-like predicted oxidoreductase